MASITSAVLSIAHDHEKKTAKVKVTCNVKFTALELCQMKTCKGNWFKLKCQLWGEDSGLFDPVGGLLQAPIKLEMQLRRELK